MPLPRFRNDSFDELPLYQHGPAEAEPLSSPCNDPSTAVAASQDELVQAHVRRGTARCLLILLDHPHGLTDDEAVDSYFAAYPEEARARGTIGLVRSALRNWCLLKPNDDTRNRLQKNLNLICRTGDERANRYSGRRNVVFNFIDRPNDAQREEWRRLANGDDFGEDCG